MHMHGFNARRMLFFFFRFSDPLRRRFRDQGGEDEGRQDEGMCQQDDRKGKGAQQGQGCKACVGRFAGVMT